MSASLSERDMKVILTILSTLNRTVRNFDGNYLVEPFQIYEDTEVLGHIRSGVSGSDMVYVFVAEENQEDK